MQDNRTFEFWWTPTFEYYADGAKALRRLRRGLSNEALTVGSCLAVLAVEGLRALLRERVGTATVS